MATLGSLLNAVTGLLLFAAIVAHAGDGRLSQYAYEDTKRLVAFVEEAATLMEREGERAFTEFGTRGSRWMQDGYLFVYTPEGTNVFHPIEHQLVGRNLMGMRDANGKPVVRLITDIARNPARDASDWLFYLWEDQTQLIPLWKSSYIRKVITPGGRTYLIGSGRYNMKIEKAWVEERVKQACARLQAKGRDDAFKELLEASSPFAFLGTYIFVLDTRGHTLVDPAFPTMAGRNLSTFRDAVGMPVIQELLHKLANREEAWVQYLWSKPGSQLPSRKLIYARRITLNGEALVIGSDFFLATPIWMK